MLLIKEYLFMCSYIRIYNIFKTAKILDLLYIIIKSSAKISWWKILCQTNHFLRSSLHQMITSTKYNFNRILYNFSKYKLIQMRKQ